MDADIAASAENVKAVPALSVSEFAEQLEALARDIECFEREAIVQIADRIGKGHKLFLHCRDEGGFQGWVENRLGYSRSHAYRLLDVDRLVKASQSWDIFGTLPVSAIYQLAAPSTPEKARKEIAERMKTGEQLSCAAVTEVIVRAKITETGNVRFEVATADARLEAELTCASIEESSPSVVFDAPDQVDDADDSDADGSLDTAAVNGEPAGATASKPANAERHTPRRTKTQILNDKAKNAASSLFAALSTVFGDPDVVDPEFTSAVVRHVLTERLDDLIELAQHSAMRPIITAAAAKLGAKCAPEAAPAAPAPAGTPLKAIDEIKSARAEQKKRKTAERIADLKAKKSGGTRVRDRSRSEIATTRPMRPI